MGMNLKLSSSATGTRNAAVSGQGGGANLRQQNLFAPAISVVPSSFYTPGTGSPAISTADYYHMDGLYWFRCYDLTTFGATGISLAASRGRYFWIASPDHPSIYGWRDGKDFRGGFSSRLGVLPATMDKLFRDLYLNQITRGGTEQWGVYHTPYLVYNPDDVTYPFYLYCEGMLSGGTFAAPHLDNVQHEEGLVRSADLTTWINNGPSHFNTVFGDWSSFQRVIRNGVNDWYSVGFSTSGHNLGGYGKWTATDPLGPFTQVSTGLVSTLSSRLFEPSASDEVTISAQKWLYCREDARSADGGMYITRVAVDSNYNMLASPAPVRISAIYTGDYPGPSYLQSVNTYIESGVAHIFATHGEFNLQSQAGTQGNLPYIGDSLVDPYDGSGTHGPLRQQNVDYYTEIVDAATAAQSSPVGLQASCASGTVTLTWLDALPNQTYRVYRGTSAGTQATLVGDVTGVTTTNAPTTNTQYWYKVVTLQSGTERGNSVASVYCSANSALTNTHIDRVLNDGADATTIDATWIEACVAWLSSQSLTSSLMYWADPAFGTKKSGSTVQKIYCLGTTLLPRGGDYTPSTTNTTYSATGMNSTVPGWTNPSASDRGYFGNGRTNNIRRKVQITCFAAYKKPNSNAATLMAMNEFSNGLVLQHTSGTPGNASFLLKPSGTAITATKAPASETAANIILGICDGANLTTYANGVAGTPQTWSEANTDLALTTALKGIQGYPNELPFLGSGSANSKYNVTTETYTFSDAQGQFSASALGAFEKGLSGAQAVSFTSHLRTRIGA